MRANSRSYARGFTLLEVLAALVIISLGMLGAIEAISQTASNASRTRDRTIAHWVGMNRLTAVRLQPNAPKIDKTSDEVEMAGRKWRWTMEVTETPVKSLRRIDIRVAEAEADEDSTVASVTGFYGSAIATQGMLVPSWSGPPVQNLPPGAEQPGQGETPEPPGGGQNPEPETPPPSGDETTDPPLPDRPEPSE
jgi:general secretion pathway protein I